MTEKILIKSKHYNVKKFLVLMITIGIVLSLFLSSYFISDYGAKYDSHVKSSTHIRYCDVGDCFYIDNYGSALSYAFSRFFSSGDFLFCIIIALAFIIIGSLIYGWLRSYELTVTDKRVYGVVAWGKRVDLPVDSISAVSSGLLKSVSISTSSGRISFLLIKNVDAIYKVLNNLLIERQQKKSEKAVAVPSPKLDETEKLEKYKRLLDEGVITQEEFDAKKKQLLDL